MKISPEVGLVSRLIIFKVVVFPQPLAPIMVTRLPLSTVKEMSFKTMLQAKGFIHIAKFYHKIPPFKKDNFITL